MTDGFSSTDIHNKINDLISISTSKLSPNVFLSSSVVIATVFSVCRRAVVESCTS